MAKSKTSAKETHSKFVQNLGIWLYVYFVFSLIIGIAVIYGTMEGAGESAAAVALLSVIAITVIGMVFTHYFRKMKMWALVALLVLFALDIISSLALTSGAGMFKIPVLKILFFILLIASFKHFKK